MVQKKKESEEGEMFFVGVKYPNEVRRGLLESQKGVISFLRRYEALRALRVKKVEKIDQLRTEIDELSKLVMKVRRDLPKAGLREEKPLAEKKKEYESAPERTSEVDKLEAELSYIEKKLKNLS
jgi:hypothetical protein